MAKNRWHKCCRPLWAAIAADINQYLEAHHERPLGNANATFYTVSATAHPFVAFHDITKGNNLYYPAHKGYDLATGLGTPDAWNLARNVELFFHSSHQSAPHCRFPQPSSQSGTGRIGIAPVVDGFHCRARVGVYGRGWSTMKAQGYVSTT